MKTQTTLVGTCMNFSSIGVFLQKIAELYMME